MKTNLKLTQNGRSMVEMLGVLAIIGVLSVAGVQGYTTAMNKHRANEILNEASKRAVVVAAQIASGRTPTLTEFPDNEVGGAEFDQQVKNASGAVWSASDSQFKIGYVSGKEPSEAVQKQMKNIAGTNGMIKSFDGGLTYNNDLGSGTASAGLDKNKCTTAGGELKGGDQYCLFKKYMNWEEVYNKCASIGGSMVSLSNVGCNTSSCSSLPSDLKGAYFWTFDCNDQTCEENKLTNKTSGVAYYVSSGFVGYTNRDGDHPFALCK